MLLFYNDHISFFLCCCPAVAVYNMIKIGAYFNGFTIEGAVPGIIHVMSVKYALAPAVEYAYTKFYIKISAFEKGVKHVI